MALKYMDLPLERPDRAKIHLRNAIQHALYYPDQRFDEDTFRQLKGAMRELCDLWNTSLHDDFHKWKLRKEEYRTKEKYKATSDLGRKARGEDYRVLDDESSLYYACLIHAADREIEFRLGLVHCCVEWARGRYTTAVSVEKIGRRIALKKNIWPFPRYEPTMVRVRRTRPGERKTIKPEYPKEPNIFSDTSDLENLLDD